MNITLLDYYNELNYLSLFSSFFFNSIEQRRNPALSFPQTNDFLYAHSCAVNGPFSGYY